MNASTAGGLLFLLAGILVFVLGIAAMSWRERRRGTLQQSVSHFRRTRGTLHKIFRAHEQDREVSMRRARSDHPAGTDEQVRRTTPRRRRPA